MPPPNIKLGPQSGEHGSYTFFKSFKYLSKARWRHIELGKFFFIRISKDSPVCIGELQLVWTGKHSSNALTSIRLYYLPEQTPAGRQSHHGEDELIATEKVVLYAKDLIKWIACDGVDWCLGLPYFPNGNKDCQCHRTDGLGCNVQIVNYHKYCRVKTALKLIQHSKTSTAHEELKKPEMAHVYGLYSLQYNCYIMFARETFENPELDRHEYRCDHLAPNLKGRPRKKSRNKSSSHHESTSNGEKAEASSSTKQSSKPKDEVKVELKDGDKLKQILSTNEKFTKVLYQYMKDIGTPITKVPSLGFKKVDLYAFFKHAYNLGGYKQICQKRLWKRLYDLMGGNPHNTSAANCTKRQYERLLLPFEKHTVKRHASEEGAKYKKVDVKTVRDLKVESVGDRDEEMSQTTDDEDSCPSNHLLMSVGLVSLDKTKQSSTSKTEPVSNPDAAEQNNTSKSDSSINAKTSNVNLPTSSNTKLSLTNNIVSASATWKVPGPESSAVAFSSEAPSTNETKGIIQEDRKKVTLLAGDPPMTQMVATVSRENMRVHAHGFKKTPMPLNVFGPCHPNQLIHAEKSPWVVRLSSMFPDPEAKSKGLKKHEIKRLAVEELNKLAIDLSAKRIKLEASTPTAPAPVVKTKQSECGAIDLSMKSKASSVSPVIPLTVIEKSFDEPLNFAKPKIEPTLLFPPTVPMSPTHNKHNLVKMEAGKPSPPNGLMTHRPTNSPQYFVHRSQSPHTSSTYMTAFPPMHSPVNMCRTNQPTELRSPDQLGNKRMTQMPTSKSPMQQPMMSSPNTQRSKHLQEMPQLQAMPSQPYHKTASRDGADRDIHRQARHHNLYAGLNMSSQARPNTTAAERAMYNPAFTSSSTLPTTVESKMTPPPAHSSKSCYERKPEDLNQNVMMAKPAIKQYISSPTMQPLLNQSPNPQNPSTVPPRQPPPAHQKEKQSDRMRGPSNLMMLNPLSDYQIKTEQKVAQTVSSSQQAFDSRRLTVSTNADITMVNRPPPTSLSWTVNKTESDIMSAASTHLPMAMHMAHTPMGMTRMTAVGRYDKPHLQPVRMAVNAAVYPPPPPHMQQLQRFVPAAMFEAGHAPMESYPPGMPAPPRLQPIPSRHLSHSSHKL